MTTIKRPEARVLDAVEVCLDAMANLEDRAHNANVLLRDAFSGDGDPTPELYREMQRDVTYLGLRLVEIQEALTTLVTLAWEDDQKSLTTYINKIKNGG